jgi:response regulator RpfG family c-di-GMP phosphodiesterase
MTWGMHTKDSPGKGRVLVVDDEENVRKLVRVSLTKAGYDVEEAENGEEAEKIIQTKDNPFMVDVILCDIRMPKGNGIEAIAFSKTVPLGSYRCDHGISRYGNGGQPSEARCDGLCSQANRWC